jgi:hypothetical protein
MATLAIIMIMLTIHDLAMLALCSSHPHRGCQQSVMLIKSELQKAGYRTWMDIDKMSGSTLEVSMQA